jgi:hypothetical protein
MPDASTSLPKRKRGGQPGNRNRLIHGRYSKEEAAWREKMRGYRRKGRALVILVDNVLKARKALKRKLAARALAAAAGAQRSVPRGTTVSARASSPSDRVRTVSADRPGSYDAALRHRRSRPPPAGYACADPRLRSWRRTTLSAAARLIGAIGERPAEVIQHDGIVGAYAGPVVRRPS